MSQASQISTQGIHHVSINVKDVDAAIEFYVGVLNLELLTRPDLGFPGAWIQAGGQEIHLLGIDSGPPVKEQHFAFDARFKPQHPKQPPPLWASRPNPEF